jgi:hypothetical protein
MWMALLKPDFRNYKLIKKWQERENFWGDNRDVTLVA